jgi:hypothetical protein
MRPNLCEVTCEEEEACEEEVRSDSKSLENGGRQRQRTGCHTYQSQMAAPGVTGSETVRNDGILRCLDCIL